MASCKLLHWSRWGRRFFLIACAAHTKENRCGTKVFLDLPQRSRTHDNNLSAWCIAGPYIVEDVFASRPKTVFVKATFFLSGLDL
jgi:hypothetical protein